MRAAWIAAALLSGVACGGHVLPIPAPASSPPRIDSTRAEAAVRAMTPRVEAIRGLRFLRPVEVRTVGDEEARAYVLERLVEFSPRERLEAEETAFVLLGLLPAGSDLERLFLDAIEEQAGGFYDPDTGSFFLLDDMPASLAPALAAHELTHALEDQHYDLDARLREAIDDDDRFLARSAVHEGSAILVMTIVTAESLRDGSAPAQDLRDFQESAAGRGEKLAELPPLLERELLGVYFLGASFLLRGRPSASVASGAFPVEDVRRAYEDGPESSEQILHPEKYWDPGTFDPPRTVAVPTPPTAFAEGWTVVADGVLGELALGVLTGAPTPEPSSGALVPPSSWTHEAAAGWGGDRWALWRHHDGRTRAVLDTVWDSEEDAREFAATIDRPDRVWRRSGDRVVVIAGDPAAGPVAEALLGVEGAGAGP
jgi:hypothetical protein